jgi:hypothetical protein
MSTGRGTASTAQVLALTLGRSFRGGLRRRGCRGSVCSRRRSSAPSGGKAAAAACLGFVEAALVGMGPREGAGDKKGRPGVSGAVAAGRNQGFRPCCGRPLREERGRIGMTGGAGLAAGEEGRAGKERAYVAAARVGERSAGSDWAGEERDGSGRGPCGGKEGRGVLGLGETWPRGERESP